MPNSYDVAQNPDEEGPRSGEADLPAVDSTVPWAQGGFMRESGFIVSQTNGDTPKILLGAHAPGDHGISFLQNELAHGIEASGTSINHTIFVTTRTEGSITNDVGARSATFIPKVGTIAIAPEGTGCRYRGPGSMGGYFMMVPKATLAFALAERGRAGAHVIEREDEQDLSLLHVGSLLARQVAEGFVDDPIAWYELTDAVVQRLVDAHLSHAATDGRGRLDPRTTARVIDYIHSHFEGSLGVDEIAGAAEQNWSHFPRLFRRSVGLSPHQYLVKVRLDRAMQLLRSTRLSLAEIAVDVGFADQSHLNRWISRMYGAPPGQFLRAFRENLTT